MSPSQLPSRSIQAYQETHILLQPVIIARPLKLLLQRPCTFIHVHCLCFLCLNCGWVVLWQMLSSRFFSRWKEKTWLRPWATPVTELRQNLAGEFSKRGPCSAEGLEATNAGSVCGFFIEARDGGALNSRNSRRRPDHKIHHTKEKHLRRLNVFHLYTVGQCLFNYFISFHLYCTTKLIQLDCTDSWVSSRHFERLKADLRGQQLCRAQFWPSGVVGRTIAAIKGSSGGSDHILAVPTETPLCLLHWQLTSF